MPDTYQSMPPTFTCLTEFLDFLLHEGLTLDLSPGDIVLGGKWKNKRMVVKSIGKDELGQPTVNGKSLLTVRIEKDLPEDKKSKQTRDEENE